MSIEVYWLNDSKTVMVNQVEGLWSLDEFWTSFQQTQHLMASVTHKVHLILDMRLSKGLPPGFMSSLRSIRSKAHPNTGMTVLVGANPLLVAFNKMFTRLFAVKASSFAMVSTMPDAYNELKQRGIDIEAASSEPSDSDSQEV